jgi:hypothetical protein
MSITKRIKKAIENDKGKNQESSTVYLNEYYEKVKKLGIVKKQEYNIPPIDTVGRRLYEQYVVRDKEETYK